MQLIRKKRARPVVPIISLIDILAILLIFFIATMTFRTPRSVLPIHLPRTHALSTTEVREVRLELSVTADGGIYLQDQPVQLEQLAASLVSRREANPQLKLELKADQEISLGLTIAIWDALTQAGFSIREVPTRVTQGSGAITDS